MKKIVKVFFILALLIFLFSPNTYAAARGQQIWDDAGLLTESELTEVDMECTEVSKANDFGVYIVTTETFEGNDILEWADRIYMENEFGLGGERSGILLVISMQERDWGIVTFGHGKTVFTDYGLNKVSDIVLEDLHEEDYYNAFLSYTDTVQQFLEEEVNGIPYSEEHTYDEEQTSHVKLNPFVIIIGAFILSLGISFFILNNWKREMNTRRKQNSASQYLRTDSFQLSQSKDMYLYRTVNRIRKQENSSSNSPRNTSSGGRGVSGKF